MDEFTLKHLYGSTGPSRAEQTSEYSPPESFHNASWYHGPTSTNLKYDMWSVGVVMLELILGTPNVFQISARTQALLDPHIAGWNEDLKELAYKLRSFMELCILIPGSSSKHHRSTGQVGDSPASWKCSEEFFSNQIKNRDPLKIGILISNLLPRDELIGTLQVLSAGLLVTLSSPKGRFAGLEREGVAWAGGPSLLVD
ncbi:hypothetical protein NC653_014593 [Populus alba x Populus x berolinensis]|uniref:Protein kinase domain-containing protein n=1 Tax=Populus alba x Populus x berolinensis TaxID=444605 RepID=A0AAD6W430_9ROSI|nr:hypothetical protein NC653_014593 [Populus alba x Populus x berolinensis]